MDLKLPLTVGVLYNTEKNDHPEKVRSSPQDILEAYPQAPTLSGSSQLTSD